MILCSVSNFELVKEFRTRLAVRIFFDRRNYHTFYLSTKQYNKLVSDFSHTSISRRVSKTVLCVLDGDRYVWSGIEYKDYSDRPYLEKHFGAESRENFKITTEVEVHIPNSREPINLPPDETLTR